MTLPGAIGVTLFDDPAATRKREMMLSYDALTAMIRDTTALAKDRLPWLKLARLGNAKSAKGSLRHDRNVIAVTGIEADYDGEQVAFDEAVEITEKAGLLAILYTSPSHSSDRPRWRILCPFSREQLPATRGHYLARINGLYGGIFAVESWTLSQSYYFGAVAGNPAHRAEIVDGEPVDPLDELDQIAIGKPNGVAGADHERPGAAAGPLDEKALVGAIISGESYHVACVRLVGKWAQQGVPLLEAQQRLLRHFDSVLPPDRDTRWGHRRNDVPRIVLDIYGKEAAQRDDRDSREGGSGGSGAGQDQADLGEWDSGDDDAPIPPRGWLLGNTFCRRFLSSLLGDGGIGKTSLRIAQLLACATGRPLTGEHVFRRRRVLLISFEDDRDELRRRIRAGMKHHAIAPADVKGWLSLAAPKGLKLIEKSPTGGEQPGRLAGLLRATINKRRIDLVCLDPFIKTHGVEENDNNAIDRVCDLLAAIAIELDIAVDAPHHVRKSGVAPAAGDADRGRGASAMKDAFRLVYTLTPMAKDERDLFGISEAEARHLVRYDSGKVNIAPPAVEARWFRLVGVNLGNGTDEYPNSDEVQTIEPWTPPDMWATIGTALANEILDQIEAGNAKRRRYSADSRAGAERAAWRVVAVKVPALTEKQSRTVIATWLTNGVLETRSYDDPATRKEENGLFVNDAKRPG